MADSSGNVLSSAWVGRNFFIALRSPAVTEPLLNADFSCGVRWTSPTWTAL